MAAGYGPGKPKLSAEYDAETIAKRVLAKNTEIRKLLADELDIEEVKGSDTDVDVALADAADAALGSSSGGKRRIRGGGLKENVQDALKAIGNIPRRTLDRIRGDIDRLNSITQAAGGALADAAGAMGRLSTFGLYSGVLVGAASALQYVPSPSWTQVVESLGNIATNVGAATVTAGQAAITNPTVALAVATLIMKYRAQAAGISVRELIRQDASALRNAVAARTTGPGALGSVARRVGREAAGTVFIAPGQQSTDMALEEGQDASLRTTIAPGSATARRAPSAALSGIASPFGVYGGPPAGTGTRAAHEAARAAAMEEDNEKETSSSSSSSSSGYGLRSKNKKEGGATCGGRRRPLSAPTRRGKRSSSSSKKGYTRRQRALRS